MVKVVWACFQHRIYSGWILKSNKPKPPGIWIQKQNLSHHHYVAYCIFFRHAIYNTKLIAQRCLRSVFPTPASGFYLDCFVLGSLITKHSFRSPNLLKYSCRPSETDDKNGPLRNRELNHNRLFQT